MSGVHLAPGETSILRIVRAVRQLMTGRDDACGTVTLTISAASTVVAAPNCAETSAVFLECLSAAAAAERASGNMFVSAIVNGAFTITHTNSATTGRTFNWTARG